jgi:glycogen synthase
MTKDLVTPDYIFETSWEVCNKVGGIYTALSTRARTLSAEYKNKLIFIGPDLWGEVSNPYFIESLTLFKEWKRAVKLVDGLTIRIGRWNIPGKPIAILVDYKKFFENKDEIYGQFWSLFGVNSLEGFGDYDDSSMFGYSVGVIIDSFYRYHKLQDQKVIAHFNEWQTAFGELYLKHYNPDVATVFTTHATSIGRSIAEHNKPLYDNLHAYNGDQMAFELNMEAKHSSEKRAAQFADCFTTVSEITAKECEQLLEKPVDVVLPNGFENDFVPQNEQYKVKCKEAKEVLRQVAEILLGHELSDDVLFVGTSGRYEYKNKGIDVFIDALKMLNDHKDLNRDIVAFIMVPGHTVGPRQDLIEKMQNPYSKAKIVCPHTTHKLYDANHDSVMKQLKWFSLHNRKDQKVKVIFVPSYLDEKDGIFNKSYYDILIGFDMTVFPSYYEPWGYTPLESAIFSIPTITTDLSGFGKWVADNEKSTEIDNGVAVVHRNDSNYMEVAEQIQDILVAYSLKSEKEVLQIRKKAFKISQKALWKNFISNYYQAYHVALSKKKIN